MDKLPGPVLQILQQCQERGCPLTWNAIGDGNHTTVTLTWKFPQQHKPFSKTLSGRNKRKSPCQRKRDQQRLERWKERRKQNLKPKEIPRGGGGISVHSIHTDKSTTEFGIQTLVTSKETSTLTDSVHRLEKATEVKPSQRDKYSQTFKRSIAKWTQTDVVPVDRSLSIPPAPSVKRGKSNSLSVKIKDKRRTPPSTRQDNQHEYTPVKNSEKLRNTTSVPAFNGPFYRDFNERLEKLSEDVTSSSIDFHPENLSRDKCLKTSLAIRNSMFRVEINALKNYSATYRLLSPAIKGKLDALEKIIDGFSKNIESILD